ncbi:hypothetical protein [Nevskia ramosa]|uniref:hypothetical protein n=1 Tax=Nevskia ramosa TaxID=64002 RepID=UPI0023553FCE
MSSAIPPPVTVHGVFVAVDGLGVWLKGASGAGKSELGLELISRGHRLIADDAIDLHLEDEPSGPRLIGRCPPLLESFIEVRGLGILNLRRLYGDEALVAEATLDLVIDLDATGEASPDERLSGRRTLTTVHGIAVATVALPRRVGHNLAVLVEAACRDHRLRLAGYDACADLVARQAQRIVTEPF